MKPDGVAQRLYAQYFCGENLSEKVTSSHWKEEEKNYRQEAPGEGSNIELICRGMGVLKWRDGKQRLLDLLSYALHMAVLPGRLNILRHHLRLRPVIRRLGADLTMEVVFRHLCTAALLSRTSPPGGWRSILMIGDGYGVLGAFLKELYPAACITFVDLGKSLTIQASMMEKAFPSTPHRCADAPCQQSEAGFVYCPAEQCDWLDQDHFDLAVNVASMQEMDPPVVATYFKILRQRMTGDRMFYCCNRKEKTLPDGTISRFLDYPWSNKDQLLVDEPCPWHHFFLSRWPTPKGFHVLGWRVPWINFYDGVHRHRLVKMSEG